MMCVHTALRSISQQFCVLRLSFECGYAFYLFGSFYEFLYYSPEILLHVLKGTFYSSCTCTQLLQYWGDKNTQMNSVLNGRKIQKVFSKHVLITSLICYVYILALTSLSIILHYILHTTLLTALSPFTSRIYTSGEPRHMCPRLGGNAACATGVRMHK